MSIFVFYQIHLTKAKIQMAAIKNRGARDLDFFFFRLAHFLNPVTSL